MMASNLISRLLPRTSDSPSIYETIRQHDQDDDGSDIEERAGLGLALDEENLGGAYHDYHIEDALADATTSQFTAAQSRAWFPAKKANRRLSKPTWARPTLETLETEDGDDEVPASLLVEHDQRKIPTSPPPPVTNRAAGTSPIPGPATTTARRQWEATQAHQALHPEDRKDRSRVPASRVPQGHLALAMADPKQKAMWMWTNTVDIDNFLKDVYVYYLGNGIWSIILNRILSLLTFAFVVGFSTFLTSCVNYRLIRGSDKMSQILIPQCTKKLSFSANFVLWLLTFIWIAKLFQYTLDIRRLQRMHDFFHYLLGISDTDIQTISWQEVVSRLMALRDSNPTTAANTSATHRAFLGTQSKQRMDAHDIANRLMRKENYLIALFNKDILDLTLPLPFLRNRQLFSRTLEWNINFCIINYVFNDEGHLRPIFLKDTHRRALSDALRRRFIFAGIMNIVAAPFIVFYFLMHYFFRYFTEYQKNPSQIGSRQYTPLAEWKFREFNELWHLFQRRIKMSYPFASRYIDQFPKDKTAQISGFIAFIAGALASVLALASVIDPEVFLGFEITPDRTVLFYLSVFGTIWAVTRGLVPEENLVFDPEYALHEVIDFTHYRPSHWTGRLHSDEVRQEFAMLYRMKVLIFLEEILSMIFTPFVLCFSLPNCSERLIDFFREFTVHVDGLGYVCSFAVFDFKKGTNAISQGGHADEGTKRARSRNSTVRTANPPPDLRDDYFSTKDGKMLASYYGFLDNYAGGGPHLHHNHPSAKRQHHFHPPPAFPGLTSPTHAPSDPSAANPNLVRPDRWDRNESPMSRLRASPSAALGRASRFGAASPMPSMLLDPHHQPSTSGFRSMSSGNRFKHSRHPLHATEDVIADDGEDEDRSGAPVTGIEDSANDDLTGVADRRASRDHGGAGGVGMGGDTDDEEEEDVKAVVEGAGVLGLITQFQKVRSEGRGGVEL